jgi:hypothetical protein
LDAEKLALLYRGGFIKEVKKQGSLEQAVFKQLVAVYHYRVRQRVREAHRITHLFRQHGIVIREKAYVAAEARPALLGRLPANGMLQQMVKTLWQGYDQLVEHEEKWRQRLVKAAQQEEVARRFQAKGCRCVFQGIAPVSEGTEKTLEDFSDVPLGAPSAGTPAPSKASVSQPVHLEPQCQDRIRLKKPPA